MRGRELDLFDKLKNQKFVEELAQGRQDREFLDCVYSEIEAIDKINEFREKFQYVNLCFESSLLVKELQS